MELKFLRTNSDTNGKILEMGSTYHAHSREPAAHYHPCQDEFFTVISGELTVRTKGALHRLSAGEKIHISKGQVHSMWNDSDEETKVNWKVTPAMNTEYFLETVNGLATDGKTNNDGMPGLLQVALLARKFNREFRLAKPPFIILNLILLMLAPIALLAGYRSTYERYLN